MVIVSTLLFVDYTLQSVDVPDSDYFPEGGEFLLSSEQDSFTLKEIGYLKHRKRDFTYFFKASRLEAAYYVDYR